HTKINMQFLRTHIMHERVEKLRRFFFSSRGRHTRFSRDWSSDVCSSDLRLAARTLGDGGAGAIETAPEERAIPEEAGVAATSLRSEERRVGKEGRSGRGTDDEKERKKRRGSEVVTRRSRRVRE